MFGGSEAGRIAPGALYQAFHQYQAQGSTLATIKNSQACNRPPSKTRCCSCRKCETPKAQADVNGVPRRSLRIPDNVVVDRGMNRCSSYLSGLSARLLAASCMGLLARRLALLSLALPLPLALATEGPLSIRGGAAPQILHAAQQRSPGGLPYSPGGHVRPYTRLCDQPNYWDYDTHDEDGANGVYGSWDAGWHGGRGDRDWWSDGGVGSWDELCWQLDSVPLEEPPPALELPNPQPLLPPTLAGQLTPPSDLRAVQHSVPQPLEQPAAAAPQPQHASLPQQDAASASNPVSFGRRVQATSPHDAQLASSGGFVDSGIQVGTDWSGEAQGRSGGGPMGQARVLLQRGKGEQQRLNVQEGNTVAGTVLGQKVDVYESSAPDVHSTTDTPAAVPHSWGTAPEQDLRPQEVLWQALQRAVAELLGGPAPWGATHASAGDSTLSTHSETGSPVDSSGSDGAVSGHHWEARGGSVRSVDDALPATTQSVNAVGCMQGPGHGGSSAHQLQVRLYP